jgi:hypothetical protein
MSCYICLEDEGELMKTRGCGCKGSVAIHKACLQEWLDKAENPFQCSVCKGDYAGTFLTNFLTEEEILLHPMGEEEEEDDDDMEFYNFHGIPIIETPDELLFDSEKHKSIYFQCWDKEDNAIKRESQQRQKNAMRFQVKAQRRAKWSKSIPFRK